MPNDHVFEKMGTYLTSAVADSRRGGSWMCGGSFLILGSGVAPDNSGNVQGDRQTRHVRTGGKRTATSLQGAHR